MFLATVIVSEIEVCPLQKPLETHSLSFALLEFSFV